MYRTIYLLGDLRDLYLLFSEENAAFIALSTRVCIFLEILYDLAFRVFVNMIFKKHLTLKCPSNPLPSVIVVK